MIINGKSLLEASPIKGMHSEKIITNQVTAGMSEAGYDIRIKQGIHFVPANVISYHPNLLGMAESGEPAFFHKQLDHDVVYVIHPDGPPEVHKGNFVLASTIEEFQMPECLVGIVHDKSSWARRGLSVFNTVIESGWNGFLTLELVFHGNQPVVIPPGSGIAQVIFHETKHPAQYTGRYQNQADKPVSAINAKKE